MSPRPRALVALGLAAFFSIATSERKGPTISDTASIGEIALSATAPGQAVELRITSSAGDIEDSVQLELGVALENHASESVQVDLYVLTEAWDGSSTPDDAGPMDTDWQLLDSVVVGGALGSEPELIDTALAGWLEASEDDVHLVLWMEGAGDITGEGQVTVSITLSADADPDSSIQVEVL